MGDFEGAAAQLFEYALGRLGQLGAALRLTFQAVAADRVNEALDFEIEQYRAPEHCALCLRNLGSGGHHLPDRRRANRAFPILRAVSIETGFSIDELKGPSRLSDVARARYRAFWRLRQAGWSTVEIGRVMGGRDHSTVIAGLKRFEAMMVADASLAARMRGYSAIEAVAS